MASGVYLTFFGSFVFGTAGFPLSDVRLQKFAEDVAAGRLNAKPSRVFRFEEIRYLAARRVSPAGKGGRNAIRPSLPCVMFPHFDRFMHVDSFEVRLSPCLRELGASPKRELALALALREIVEDFLDIAHDARDKRLGRCFRDWEEGAQLTLDASTHIPCLD